MIKARSSKMLREEFPHLKEWCSDISGLPVATTDLWALIGNWLKSISQHTIICEYNKRYMWEISIYRPWTFCPGYTGDFDG